MGYLKTMTLFLSEIKNPKVEMMLYDLFELIKQMVSELVREELAKLDLDKVIDIRTQINGVNASFPEIENYIRKEIEKRFSK